VRFTGLPNCRLTQGLTGPNVVLREVRALWLARPSLRCAVVLQELLMEVHELVAEIVKAIVDRPEDVVITQVEGAHTCVLELQVAREDVGKVIGKKGVHADAIRRIVHAIGGKKKKRYVLEIIEER
jgi:uncharacterized protein